MATLADTIKGTSGLLAYWPLTDNTDQSGNGRHLTVMGSPTFGQSSMTTDAHPSVQTTGASTLRIDQSTLPKIKAVEGWFRLAGPKTGGIYSPPIGINVGLSGAVNRYILFYHDSGFTSYQNITNPATPVYYYSTTQTWENLSYLAHHFVVQLNAAGTQTEVYIDGVKDTAMTVPLDVFLQSAGYNLTVGAFITNGTTSGLCQCSDYAIYDRPLTAQEITSRQQYNFLNSMIMLPVRITATPANQEARAQFQPQDVTWRGSPGFVYPGPMPNLPIKAIRLCAGISMQWVRDGVQNVLQGYIESTVTIDGEGVRRRVLCLDQAGNLIGETYSRASDGKYRFDLLWLNRRYMLVAQDDPAFGPADYNAVAADFQLPTPYAPGEGVGLA